MALFSAGRKPELLLLTVLLVATGLVCAELDLADAVRNTVNGDEVVADLEKLAEISDAPQPAVTRILFTKTDMEARKFIVKLMKEAGLKVRSDPMGNIFGRWEGSNPDAPALLCGSHIDAIPMSGKYDGTLGVIGAIHAVKALKGAGFKPKNPIEVVMFTSEEPTRFGISCIGSRGLSGAMSSEDLDSIVDSGGKTFQDAAKDAGYGGKSHSDILMRTALNPREVLGFIELHIEQGPLLEDMAVDVGIVTAIAAPATIRATFQGSGGHAGGLLMHYRNDAGLAAAELALAVERAVHATGSVDTVGTTGKMEMKPNAVNSVPSEATVEIDIRDTDLQRRDEVVSDVLMNVGKIAKKRKVSHSHAILNQDPPVSCSGAIKSSIEASAIELKLVAMELVSRPYHDALFMARIAPTGMIFVPCKNGISHTPDEYASPKDIANGVRIMALTMAKVVNGSQDAPETSDQPSDKKTEL